jgi:hypothetical protein
LLIKGVVSREGDVDIAVGREEGDQLQQAADEQGDPALDVKEPNSTHTEPWPLDT